MSTHCLEPLTEDRCTRWNSAPKNSAKSRRPKSRKSTGQEALANEELLQTWVAHHLMIIGEACRALSADFWTTHPAEVRALAPGLRTPSGNDAGFTAHNAGASPKINNSFTFRPFCLSYRQITRRRVAARFLPGAFREFPPGPIARRPGSIDPLPPCAPAK